MPDKKNPQVYDYSKEPTKYAGTGVPASEDVTDAVYRHAKATSDPALWPSVKPFWDEAHEKWQAKQARKEEAAAAPAPAESSDRSEKGGKK